MANNVNITSSGIRKVLKNYTPAQALSEYIWNGFDANADTIRITYESEELGMIRSIEVQDNGYGIENDKLAIKFKPFYDSEKFHKIQSPRNTSLMHGKNGIGRFSFFTFAGMAEWVTTYKEKNNLKTYSIKINEDALHRYDDSLVMTDQAVTKTGTKVIFTNIKDLSEEEITASVIPYLVEEFCWFLELHKSRSYKIIINGEPLDYSSNIADKLDKEIIQHAKTGTHFRFRYIRWHKPLHKELSKFYYLNNKGDEVYKEYTTLNKKGDKFYHSVYIQSPFFDQFDFKSKEEDPQLNLFYRAKWQEEYKFLREEVERFLRLKRKPCLKIHALELIRQYREEGIFHRYTTEWDRKFKTPILYQTIMSLYEYQPSLFTNLNIDQKKTFVYFLDLLLDTSERERIFHILDHIITLEPAEKEELAYLLQTTQLNRINNTMKLLQERYQIYLHLKELVNDSESNNNNINELQKITENHFWLFGEQYHLATVTEEKINTILHKYHHLLSKKNGEAASLFITRQDIHNKTIHNIIVDLKQFNERLGIEHYMQVDNYLQTILKQPFFSGRNMLWEFYLIGKDFDDSGFLESQIESNLIHNTPSLIQLMNNGRVKVYAKKWSELLNDFKLRYDHLYLKLESDRQTILNEIPEPKNNKSIIVENSFAYSF